MNRAYSTLEIKALDDGRRRFSGIASTPATDFDGDILSPLGAEFKLPLPLLWQHDARQPIGWVTAAKASKDGIEVECEVAAVEEDGPLKARLTDAWQTLKAKLVRGLSVGFKPLESARLEDGTGYRYLRWALIELSAVTIASNQEASIQSIKSADEALRRALSSDRDRGVIRLDLPKGIPDVSGQPRRKGVVYLSNPIGKS